MFAIAARPGEDCAALAKHRQRDNHQNNVGLSTGADRAAIARCPRLAPRLGPGIDHCVRGIVTPSSTQKPMTAGDTETRPKQTRLPSIRRTRTLSAIRFDNNVCAIFVHVSAVPETRHVCNDDDSSHHARAQRLLTGARAPVDVRPVHLGWRTPVRNPAGTADYFASLEAKAATQRRTTDLRSGAWTRRVGGPSHECHAI